MKTLKTKNRKNMKTLKNICSPATIKNKIINNSCFTKDTIIKLRNIYNNENAEKIIDIKPFKIIKKLKKKFKCNDDLCLVNNIKSPLMRKEIKEKIFKPEQPKEWENNPNEWLSNFDILEVLKQYEEAYPYFRFIGPSPIDFNKRINGNCVLDDLCKFSIHNEKKEKKKFIGIIFNLDKHDGPGSHWVSIFIDIPNYSIFFFDSANNVIPNEIEEFKNKIISQNPSFVFYNNSIIHQSGNSECGIYSLYFIINMLLAVKKLHFFNKHFNNPNYKITDSIIEKYRNIYFI